MHTIVGTIVAVISFALCSTVGNAQRVPTKAYEDKTAYEVYNAILRRPCEITSGGMDWENWGCDVRNANPLLIRRDTVRWSRNIVGSQCSLQSSDEQIQLAIVNWKSVNETTWLLNDDFTLSMPHRFISAAELDDIFETTSGFCKQSLATPDKVGCSWEKFAERYPSAGGWVELSAVGFNPEKNVAVLYIGRTCGRTCGRGFMQVLRKEHEAWIPVKWAIKGCGWMS